MALECCIIQMGRSMKGNFDMESRKAMEESFIQMGMFTMANGLMIELMVMECSRTQQGLDMRESGKLTSNMEEEKRFLRKKAQFTKGISTKAKSMVKESLSGLMEAITKETL